MKRLHLAAGILSRTRADERGTRPPVLPWFALAFVAIVIVNSFGLVPASVAAAGNEISRGALVTAKYRAGSLPLPLWCW